MRRIFIAVKVHASESLKELISSMRNSLAGESIKWIDPEGIHVTLAFLGNTEEEKIRTIGDFLEGTCNGFGNFDFILKGIGVFKNLSNPKIIWVGTRNQDKLVRLNDTVNEGLKSMGFPVEERAFRPHVTIARVKSVKNDERLRFLFEKYRDTEIQAVPVDEVVLYESILGGPSAIYKPVLKVKL